MNIKKERNKEEKNVFMWPLCVFKWFSLRCYLHHIDTQCNFCVLDYKRCPFGYPNIFAINFEEIPSWFVLKVFYSYFVLWNSSNWKVSYIAQILVVNKFNSLLSVWIIWIFFINTNFAQFDINWLSFTSISIIRVKRAKKCSVIDHKYF